ncbi:hypothetical protein [Halopseudomonas salegens]|uniref:Pre-peptidase n=1 Tax=Halopseudomonas salegens TaxID=1434072 RepID=A0A1H2ELI0_9GAMM|nr:hypothetical protein [Halopseudomonas salegens]SDT96032.1 hypothetical protein SAMN05216210_0844 [Halopseudomonas salegens]
MKNITNPLCVLTAAVSLSLAGCDGSSPSDLVVGELTDVSIGFTETKMDVEITDPGFYSLFTRGDEDSVCKLYDADGALIVEDDDSGSEFNCMINTMLDAGNYTVGLSGYEVSDRGRVQLMLEALPVEQAKVGDVINLDVDAGRGAVIAFDVAEDGAFLLSTTGLMDTECHLYGADGKELGYNDDFGDDENCGLIQTLVSGRYHFVINGYEGEGGRTTFMAAPTEIQTLTLPVGEQQSARLDGAESLINFEVEIVDPGMYVFQTQGETDTYCELRDQSGEMMAENDDGSDHNCRIQHALTAGVYQFNVQGYSGSTGDFTAQADRR